ncbi:MAG TPA: RNA polymerase sigma factor [Actinomycetes bacterium]|nr:RNA polymerase sigma factor [Actinomycetes bacterium]
MLGPTFEAVLTAAVRGDDEAFRELWRDLQPPLLRYLRVRAPDVADDLAAETWLEVIRGLRRFTGDEQGFRAWMFTIARHRAIDWRRRAARQHTELLPSEALLDRAAPDDPAVAALEAISTRSALAVLATLPAEQAEAILLRVVAGLDVAEVAGIMGKRPGTVRVLTHRGLRRLAERFSLHLEHRGAG